MRLIITLYSTEVPTLFKRRIMNIRDQVVRFPAEDVEVFGVLAMYLRLLPDRVDLDARDDREDRFLYGPAYYEMLTYALGMEFNLPISKVLIVGSNFLSVFTVVLPNGSLFVINLPGSWTLGPTLFLGTLEHHIFWVKQDLTDDLGLRSGLFQRGVHKFREALHARMRALQESSGEGSHRTMGEPTQPI